MRALSFDRPGHLAACIAGHGRLSEQAGWAAGGRPFCGRIARVSWRRFLHGPDYEESGLLTPSRRLHSAGVVSAPLGRSEWWVW